MEHQEGFFKGVRDAQIYYQAWLPASGPKAVLIVVHGLGEHSGRYANVVNQVVPLGYAVYGLDHLGHGRSEGTRVYVDSFSDYTKTLDTFVSMVKEWQPGKPCFMLGHSMGGLITSTYLLDHQERLDGAILSGPAVKVGDSVSKLTITLGQILSTVVPKAGLVQLEATAVSRDPAVVEAYLTDPLVHTGKTTARLAAELVKSMQRVTAQSAEIDLPLLLLQGGKDTLVDPSGAQMLYDTVSSPDKTLHVYPELYHEVHNEPEKAQVLSDLTAWLEAHTA